jgi:hypothetical protein
MTEEEATALGKRLSVCRHFRPMPGLKDMQGRTWDDSLLWRWNREVDVPDLRQPASMGILLALVREAWGPVAHAMPWGHSSLSPAPVGWSMMLTAYDNLPTAKLSAPTEAEALVAALEAAP